MKKVLAMLCVLSMIAIPVMATQGSDSMPEAAVSLENNNSDKPVTEGEEAAVSLGNSNFDKPVIEGEVGDKFIVGDLVFEIVSDEEINEVLETPATRASTSRFSIDLSGDSLSQDFEVTTNYPWAKVWVSNKGKGDIKFTITKGSKTGYVVKGSEVTIKAGTNTSVYATKEWDPDIYYANFTCGKANLNGTSSCRVASTQHELDI